MPKARLGPRQDGYKESLNSGVMLWTNVSTSFNRASSTSDLLCRYHRDV